MPCIWGVGPGTGRREDQEKKVCLPPENKGGAEKDLQARVVKGCGKDRGNRPQNRLG